MWQENIGLEVKINGMHDFLSTEVSEIQQQLLLNQTQTLRLGALGLRLVAMVFPKP